MVFGFGRRQGLVHTPLPYSHFVSRRCPGQYLIDNLLWLVIATTLATLEILPELNEDGTPIIPSTEYTSGAVRYA